MGSCLGLQTEEQIHIHPGQETEVLGQLDQKKEKAPQREKENQVVM